MSSLIAMMGDFLNGKPKQTSEQSSSSWPVNRLEERGRKRTREGGLATPVPGSRTPTLVVPRQRDFEDDERPAKKLRGEKISVSVTLPNLSSDRNPKLQSGLLLRMVPEEVVGYVLSFVASVEDRFALQCSCKQFRRISNSSEMRLQVKLGGDAETGKNGIVQEGDTPASASAALTPFARAGNLEAVYMLGMIKSYCNQDVEGGIVLLKVAAQQGFVRSNYTLGLILRDSRPNEAAIHMNLAAAEGYLPALQELLPAREMKSKYGEPTAAELQQYLDPTCLNRLLGRQYIHSSQLREVNTSHCWNPLCGRWAFKTQVSADGTTFRTRRPFNYTIAMGDGAHGHGRRIVARRVVEPRRTMEARAGSGFARAEADSTGSVPPGVLDLRVSRMKMCSRCCRAKYCSKLCQVYDWRSGRHKTECHFL